MALNFYKKILIGLAMIGLVYNPAFFISKANAVEVLGTGANAEVVAAIEQSTATLAAPAGTTAGKAVATFTDRLWQAAKIMFGQRLKKMILDAIVDAAVKWIKSGGFEGKGGPMVSDWNAFFQDIGNQAAGEVAEATVPWLCGSFNLDLAFSLTQEPKPFSEQVKCTLTDIVDNVDKIFEDYRKESRGKWITYNTLWEPQNNYFGSALQAQDKLESRKADLLNARNVEATVNVGFKSQKKCTINKQTGKEECETITPGSVVGRQIQQTIMPKDNAIISASDLAGYIGALADAVLYRYTIMANGGLKKLLGYTDNDIKAEAGTTYATIVTDQFSQIDNITFQNNRALFIDEINSVLAIKKSTVLKLNSSINTENALVTSLSALQTCVEPAENWTTQESILIANAPIIIDDINTNTIPDLETRRDQTQSEIDKLTAIIAEFNSFTEDDNFEMLPTYSVLTQEGYLDAGAAASALEDAQTELAGIEEYSKEILESPTTATPPGYLTLIPYCKDHQSPLPTTP